MSRQRLVKIQTLAATLLLLGTGLTAHADRVRYLIKMRGGSSANAVTRKLVRSSNTLSVYSELTSSSDTGAQAARPLRHLGIVVVEGEPQALNSVLREHPLVEYYEKEISWRVSDDGQALPSSQAAAPWMANLLALTASEPDPLVTSSADPALTVAVIDTGATVTHPFLQPALVEGRNVLTRDADVGEYNTDHGTHVAGLVKSVRDQALANGYTQASRVSILPIRFISSSGVGSTSAAIDALEYALARGARVVNASWGARGKDAFSQALYDAMVELYNADVFFSVAAGNAEGGVANDNDQTPYFPANFRIPGLMSVASVTPVYLSPGALGDVYLSSFSNYGARTVDVAAPGDYRDPSGSYGVWSANAHATDASNLYIRKRGTSMAAPVVSGIAAVVRAINPSLTNYEVKSLILNTASRQGYLGKLKSSAMVQARAAFDAASTAVSRGERPPAPPSSESLVTYGGASTSAGEKRGGGGCGALSMVGGAPPEGPWGGNSLLLFSTLYLVSQAVRGLIRKRGLRVL